MSARKSYTMRPFFSYYGAKWRMALKYPKPEHEILVEPFAGSACYATRFPERKVVLYDANPVVFSVWDYLIRASESEIRSLPTKFDHIDDLALSQEQKWLIGFWLNKACVQPMKSFSKWARSGLTPTQFWSESIRERIASQIRYIRHWKVFCRSYEQIDNVSATWLIDPPYAGECGQRYTFSKIDYQHLALWCQSRHGLSIVCEKDGANWLPFSPLHKTKATDGKNGKKFSNESVWIGRTIL